MSSSRIGAACSQVGTASIVAALVQSRPEAPISRKSGSSSRSRASADALTSGRSDSRSLAITSATASS